jgi:hypothetical protein
LLKKGFDMKHSGIILISLFFFYSGFSQTADSVQAADGQENQSADSTQIADTTQVQTADSIQVIDSLQAQQPDSVAKPEIQEVEAADSALTEDSLQAPEARRVVNVDSLQEAEMNKLHFLQGQWKGIAWTMTPNREKSYIIQTEKVEVKQNGLVVAIQGSGIDQKSLQSKPKLVHDAFAILYFDKQRQKVQMMAFNKGNRILTEPILRQDNTLIWGFDIPNAGKVRYTIRLNEQGQWFEVGEFSRDGVNWFQNFEMTLDRIE